MTTIGITGNIGSGKSVVVSLLRTYGIPVYIADEESKRLVNASPVIRERLTALLGDAIYGPDGLNRRRVASLLFNDSSLLAQANAIIHPEVARHFQFWVHQQSAGYAALESAILFESGFDRTVDLRVMVYAPQPLRLQRVMARDRMTETEVLSRMDNQLSDEIKKQRSDYVIINDGKQALIPQTEKFILYLYGE
ncbi:MAG: dephospho-CoA kinase [Tannerella sp.]|jgi:dephospho-CoA kinase|nr:dephospho-CoA kinase [Tannerella sp.]